MMENWKAYTAGPANEKKPEKVVLMLHGYGSNGQDLIGLAPYFMEAVPNAIFISPDAPQPCEISSMGRQWFSLSSRDPDYMLAGIRQTAPVLDGYIDAMLDNLGLESSDLVLLGFSQGTMMSLYTAPRRTKPIAGVVGYSGALLGAAELNAPGIQKMPICLIHGEADDVVPFSAYTEGKKALEQNGFSVDGLSIPRLPHSIDDAGIQKAAAFLKKVLST